MNKILPIGAVVLLDGAKDPLMIVGYLPKGIDEIKRDYMAVVYPIGYVSLESVYTFNSDDIKEVIYSGNELNEFFLKFSDKIKAVKQNNVDNILKFSNEVQQVNI